jgi:hypothetical protein
LLQIIRQKILGKIKLSISLLYQINQGRQNVSSKRKWFVDKVNFSSGRESLSLIFQVSNKNLDFDFERELG